MVKKNSLLQRTNRTRLGLVLSFTCTLLFLHTIHSIPLPHPLSPPSTLPPPPPPSRLHSPQAPLLTFNLDSLTEEAIPFLLARDPLHRPAVTAMDRYLSTLRARLQDEPDAPVLIVTGNESADLDSFISALTTAFFTSFLKPDNIVLPFVNIPPEDLALRSDVEYVLDMGSISPSHLFFRDELPMLEKRALNQPGKVGLFLVDHNKISGSMAVLEGRTQVWGVLDHHKDEELYKETAQPRRIEVVGSCSSLVTDTFMKEAIARETTTTMTGKSKRGDHDQDPLPDWVHQVSKLLLGPILIDTQDLKEEMKKVKPLDVAMAKYLQPFTGWDSIDDLYDRINEARRDTSKLSFYDLLRKDYKEWTVKKYEGVVVDGDDDDVDAEGKKKKKKKEEGSHGRNVTVGISSVIGLLEKYVPRDGQEGILKAMERWSKERHLDLLMVLLADDLGPEKGGYKRQILFDPIKKGPTHGMDAVGGLLESHCAGDWRLERVRDLDSDAFLKRGGKAWWQHNIAISRKQVWPCVEKLLTEPVLPSVVSNL